MRFLGFRRPDRNQPRRERYFSLRQRTNPLRVSYYNWNLGNQRIFVVATLFLAVAGWAFGMDSVTQAQAELERVRALVQAGALPPLAAQKAEGAVEDARDADVLRRTLYGQDLTEQQAGEMLAAAQRRLERRQQRLDEVRSLVAKGALPPVKLNEPQQDLAAVLSEVELAKSRADLVTEIADMARREQALEAKSDEPTEDTQKTAVRYDGDGKFSTADFKRIVLDYERQFSRPLPVSARGETAVHRALGFDHRNRVDVALHPDQPEGIWLRRRLESMRIPYIGFRAQVPGKSTAAHIHLGPLSTRLAKAD